MRLLLDTHIWLWSLREPERVGKRVQHELLHPENEVWLSPVSAWEALILHEKGKVRLEGNLDVWIADATAPFRPAYLTHEIAAVSRQIALPHRDPADRFLAATTKVLGLTLVTADAALLALSEIVTLENR